MTVAYIQLFIVALLVGTYFLSRTMGFRPIVGITVLAALVTVFTFSAAHTTKLLALQLFVVWGTWFGLRTFGAKNYEIARLNGLLDEALAGLSDDVRRHAALALADRGQYRVVSGAEHRQVLADALRRVQQDLVVSSGWIATTVVDQDFASRVSAALDRGANVHLVFGYQGTAKAPSHDEAVRRLRRISQRNGNGQRGTLTLRDLSDPEAAKRGNHAKVLICDRQFAVCGSNNWLVNKKFANAEMSVLFSQPAMVEEILAGMRSILTNAKH